LFGGQIPDDTELFAQSLVGQDGSATRVWWPLKRVSTVVGNDLRNAYRTADQWGDAQVAFELTQDAGRRFETATRENVGRKMAIVLGGVENKTVISAPVIEDVIRDQGVIRGGFDVAAAEDLALQLRSGAIPTDVTIMEERTVGPSLGRDSIRAGLTAGLASFLGVMLFMLVYYRLAGVNAVVALSLNVLLVFGTLGALPFLFNGVRATLTLPGIAGLILTVGLAVDSNVLIFERIREELRVGKTIRAAVDQGFGKAFMTILDCNVTTLVAAFFLFSYGTGPVKGFAVTLTIGLLASMFTAVFVSRQLFELVLLRRQRAETLSI
jgi:preprotein translocase subunit SecD